MTVALDLLVDLVGCLPEQEQAADQEDQIAARDAMLAEAEQRRRQPHDPGDREQQADAHQHRHEQPRCPSACLL